MDVIDLFDKYAIPYKQKEYGNVYIQCPYCDKESSLSVSVHTGQWHCWSASCNKKGSFEMLSKNIGITSNFTPSVKPEVVKKLSEEDKEQIRTSLRNHSRVRAYCASRHLDADFVIKHKLIGVINDTVVLPFFTLSGDRICGAKFKAVNGQQWIKGEEPDLYLLDPKDLKKEKIVIVEGEIDAITLKQFGIPTAALLGAGKDKGYKHLSSVRSVYLGFDMDGAGEEGVKKAIAALGRYRTKRIVWTAKDPNDILKSGAAFGSILECLKKAKTTIDTPPQTGSTALSLFINEQTKEQTKLLSFGYPKLNSFTKGLLEGWTIFCLARAGVGKTTTMLNFVVNNLLAGEPVGIASYEEHPVYEITPKLINIILGSSKPSFSSDEIMRAKPYMDKVYLLDTTSRDIETFKNWVRECYYCHSVRFIMADYLQLLISDETNVQQVKKICYEVGKDLCREMPKLRIFWLIQPKQKQKYMTKDGMIEQTELDGSDARGGAAIEQSCDVFMTVKPIKGHPNIIQLEYTKVRGQLQVSKHDWLYKITQLEYDPLTLRQKELENIVYGE